MILTVTIECVRGMYWKEPCSRVIEMEENASLDDLHEAIQDAVSFDRDHLYGFYMANQFNSPWRNRLHFSDAEEWEKRYAEYRGIRLKAIRPPDKHKKLFYLFDYGDEWVFRVKISSRTKPAETGVSYPRVVKAEGPNPTQYPTWEED